MSTKDKSFAAAMAVFESNTQKREQIEYIDIDKIDEDARNFYELSDLDALVANIELCGLQQPLRVRTSPTKSSRVVIISGHRRKAALRRLVDEGREDLRQVPCIREDDPGSWALQELKLIYANSATRKITSYELAKQAERVTELFYQLKEEGYEFPGRMRDHVAEACSTTKTKLAKVKVIKENLLNTLQPAWASGTLSEQAAYAIARMPAEMQGAFAARKKHDFHGQSAEKILANTEAYLSTTMKCPDGTSCTNGKGFLLHDVADRYSYNHCEGRKCCVSCYEKCSHMCPAAKKAAEEEAKKRTQASLDHEKAKRSQSDEILAEAEDFWDRVDDLCERFGHGTLDDVADILCKYSKPTIDQILNREFDGMLWSRHEIGLEPVFKMKAVCEAIGCSADVLLGLGPSAVASRKKAEWVQAPGERDKWLCSDCGNYEFADDPIEDGFFYCSKCGAEMTKKVNYA